MLKFALSNNFLKFNEILIKYQQTLPNFFFKCSFIFPGFPMNVISLLPHLVHNYESLTPGCRDAADHIAQVRYY